MMVPFFKSFFTVKTYTQMKPNALFLSLSHLSKVGNEESMHVPTITQFFQFNRD